MNIKKWIALITFIGCVGIAIALFFVNETGLLLRGGIVIFFVSIWCFGVLLSKPEHKDKN